MSGRSWNSGRWRRDPSGKPSGRPTDAAAKIQRGTPSEGLPLYRGCKRNKVVYEKGKP